MNKKYLSRKFILMTAFFIMAQIFMWQTKISPFYWFLASATGVFGLVVVLAWLKVKGADDK